MNDIIIKDYGWCQVIKRNGKYLIRYDGGDISINMLEEELDETQFENAILNQYEAEQIILKILKSKIKK